MPAPDFLWGGYVNINCMAENEAQKNLSDEELVNLTLDTDKEFFNELVDKYYVKILRYLNRMLLSNKGDVEDGMAETFIKAYVNLSTYNPRIPFQAWLYRIAHNQAIDIIRKNARHRGEAIEDYHAVYDPVSDYIDKDALARALGTLDVDDRNLLTLFYLEGLTLNEISDIMKLKQNTVAVRLKRAKEKIRKNNNL